MARAKARGLASLLAGALCPQLLSASIGSVLTKAKIRPANPADAKAILAIYGPYVENTRITFAEKVPLESEITAQISAGSERYPWLVCEEERGEVLGYAYATAFRTRPAYRWLAETSVYLASHAQGRGLGAALYEELLRELELRGFVEAIGVVAVPNLASTKLHERLGFQMALRWPQAGFKLGEWCDVEWWRKELRTRPVNPLLEENSLTRESALNRL